MKNIHVIPTDKPSRLVKFFTNKFHLCKEILLIQDEEQYQNIYITNDEEIKEGNWFLENNTKLLKWKMSYSFPSEMSDICKKIILTDNEDLIKDGVQAIDDEFLQSFVDNPSCEFVEILEAPKLVKMIDNEFYKIIIPKDELKDINAHTGYDEEGHSLNYEGNILPLKEEPNLKKHLDSIPKYPGPRRSAFVNKQETLEEAAETISDFIKRESKSANESVGIVKGVKWQQERMYSEEEVENILIEYVKTNPTKPYRVVQWFQQFKKK